MALTLTGPVHPLRRVPREFARDLEREMPRAERIVQLHREHATSYESIIRVGGDGAAPVWMGPQETHRHLASSTPHYVAVNNRTTARGVARMLCLGAYGPRVNRARTLIVAAERAAPMVEALLALRVHAGGLTWDSDETVAAAALRLSLDAGLQILDRGWPSEIASSADSILGMVAEMSAMTAGSPRRLAEAYLDVRAELEPALDAVGVRWGATMLDAPAVAQLLDIATGTWAGYLSRGQAPSADRPRADSPAAWRAATVDAWRLTRTRDVTRHAGWWTEEPRDDQQRRSGSPS